MMNEQMRSTYHAELDKLLDGVPEAFTCYMQRQNSCVPVPPGPDDQSQRYEYGEEVALVFVVMAMGIEPQIPRIVPGDTPTGRTVEVNTRDDLQTRF